MAEDTKKKRPWWKVRRVWGGILGTTALALASIPGAPVVVAVGSIAITTQTISILMAGVGTYVFGYGVGRKVERDAE